MSIRTKTAWVLAAALVSVGAGSAAAHADGLPALAFRPATHDLVIERYADEDYVYFDFDLGVHLIAGRQPFEIRAKRGSYAEPIVAQQMITGADGKPQGVALPAGMFTSFGGFPDFTSITIKDSTGATVQDYTTPWCPNNAASVRTRPDAPATNPYPQDCGWWGYGNGGNPFLLGSVWGVQAGYNSPIQSTERPEDWWSGEPPFDLLPGEYDVTVRLNDPYKSWLEIPDADATVELNVTVIDVRPSAVPQAAKAMTEHSHEGDPAKQLSAYDPRFRPPAKIPASLPAVPVNGPKPDLRSLPAWDIHLEQAEDGKTYVTFSATVWNGGTSPLVVDGFRRTGTDLMDAYQYFYDAQGNEIGSVPAGTMEWDARAGHLHWHFTDFAQYNLLAADQNLAVRSGKEAFCLANTDPVDFTLPRANWKPGNTDLASSCGQNTAVAVREVLDVGSGDTYIQSLPGQSFDVTDLPNGAYYIEVLANPDQRLAETRVNNNESLRKIVLGGSPGARTLRVPAVHGLDPPTG